MYIARSTALQTDDAHRDIVADHLDALLALVEAETAQITDDQQARDALKIALLEVIAASLTGHPDVILLY